MKVYSFSPNLQMPAGMDVLLPGVFFSQSDGWRYSIRPRDGGKLDKFDPAWADQRLESVPSGALLMQNREENDSGLVHFHYGENTESAVRLREEHAEHLAQNHPDLHWGGYADPTNADEPLNNPDKWGYFFDKVVAYRATAMKSPELFVGAYYHGRGDFDESAFDRWYTELLMCVAICRAVYHKNPIVTLSHRRKGAYWDEIVSWKAFHEMVDACKRLDVAGIAFWTWPGETEYPNWLIYELWSAGKD